MVHLSVVCASVFAISILLTGTVTPFLLIQEADAIKSKGTSWNQFD